ncbi:ATP-dependent zinc protease [Pseudomaricurvus sp. HS19]|uniref:ATP-dependent zinc protease family protein n=1 Tax=Pseudomaricurvus sp. HS19 TaxID=2692626 RepID=UPI001368F388|nr:ATP-dependent zinc protease [Pseudomaricurvus sp. HS19]MYM61772.1 ATP-dependent Zn protease [Pseudomaricurvus sp. HS19]
MLALPKKLLNSLMLSACVLVFSGCSLLEQKTTTDPQQPVQSQEPGEAPACPQPEAPAEQPPVVEEKPLQPEPPALSCPKPKPTACPAVVSGDVTGRGDLRIIGQVEYVDVMPINMRKKARVDTGAETTSIDASDIVEFERDGKSWVKFKVEDRRTGEVSEIKAPVVRWVRIKQHGVENVRRQVVRLELRMGSLHDKVEVTLADRDRFDYPILIGRNFLQGRAVVDVSRKYLTLQKE